VEGREASRRDQKGTCSYRIWRPRRRQGAASTLMHVLGLTRTSCIPSPWSFRAPRVSNRNCHIPSRHRTSPSLGLYSPASALEVQITAGKRNKMLRQLVSSLQHGEADILRRSGATSRKHDLEENILKMYLRCHGCLSSERRILSW
jgi:hypothetical protein